MMIGPMKKKMITVGIVSFLIPTIVAGVFFVKYSAGKNAKIATLEVENAVVERYVFSGDIPVDHIIGSTDVKVVGVKEMSAPLDSYPAERLQEIVGKRIKIPAFDKTIVTENMFYKESDNVSTDLRKKEFNMINLPSDLVEGDFIDIRILFPTGEDFLVVVGKEVKQMGTNAESNSIFLELTEEELVKLSGAIIESYISDSVNLYAVKYVNNYQQLFKEHPVDYVEKYEVAVQQLISGDYEIKYNEAMQNRIPEVNASGEVIINASGEIVYQEIEEIIPNTANDYTDEEIATQAGMSVEYVQRIREAFEKSDEELLRYFRNQTVVESKLLAANYPIRSEVTALIHRNPNIIDTLKGKYNVEVLEMERQNLIDTSIRKEDAYTGELEEDASALTAIATKLDSEIEAQRAERKEYLQNMIRNNIAGM